MDTPLLATLVRRVHLAVRREVHAELTAAGHAALTPAHMYVFQQPGADGARPTELAARTNTTKQAMNHLLAGLERAGYLTRMPAADDGRGTVVRLTDRGREVERLMQAAAGALERRWAAQLGRPTMAALRQALIDVDALAAAERQEGDGGVHGHEREAGQERARRRRGGG